MIPRGQSPDNTSMRFTGNPVDTKFVGNAAAPWGLNFAKVEGVALITQLDGTGSNPRPSGQREHLVTEMHSHGVDDVDELLADENNALVVVRGFIPPAAKKGDNFDLEIQVLPKSDVTSLEDGFMMKTRLRPMAVLGNRVREGHVVAVGRGDLLTKHMFDATDGDQGLLQAFVPAGGTTASPRPVGLAIQTQSQSIKTASAISTAINGRFTTFDGNARIGVANPKNDKLIEIKVPAEYSLNVGRYFRVIGNLAYSESPAEQLDRIQKTESELNDPAMAALAAVRLEGIGKDAIPSLNRGLRSDDAEVRFHSAMALTYLGEKEGIGELRLAAENEPAFRWDALTALASTEVDLAEDALESLLHAQSSETRYGAFRSLQQRSPDDPVYHGTLVRNSFYFTTIPSDSRPMVHVARKFRPEIVLFGEQQRVQDNFLFVETGLTIKAKNRDTVEMIRFIPGEPEIRTTCSTDLEDVILTMSKLGAEYPTVVAMLKDAMLTDSLDTELVINALPKLGRQYDRSQATVEYTSETSDRYVADSLPILFETGENESDLGADNAGTADLNVGY